MTDTHVSFTGIISRYPFFVLIVIMSISILLRYSSENTPISIHYDQYPSLWPISFFCLPLPCRFRFSSDIHHKIVLHPYTMTTIHHYDRYPSFVYIGIVSNSIIVRLPPLTRPISMAMIKTQCRLRYLGARRCPGAAFPPSRESQRRFCYR